MVVHAGKYRTEDKLKIQTITKLNTTQKKTMQNTAKQNYPVQSSLMTIGQETKRAYFTMLLSPHVSQ